MSFRTVATSVLLSGVLALVGCSGEVPSDDESAGSVPEREEEGEAAPSATEPGALDPSTTESDTVDEDVPEADPPIKGTTINLDFKARNVLGPGVPKTGFDQNVVALGSLSLPMVSHQTAYVVAVMRVNSATERTLFDNEVVCKGANGWSKNFVIGQNVYKKGVGVPEWEDVTLTTRFLVHPGDATTVTCTAYIRTASLGYADSTVRLASGYLRFADTAIDNAFGGVPIQSSVTRFARVDRATPTVRLPDTGFFELEPNATGMSVFGDIEYQICAPGACNPRGSSKARFTLVVNQWKDDGTLCQTDATATVTKSFTYSVHHAYVPLNKPNFKVRTDNGCIPKFNAYVMVTWLGGETGGVQGTAKGMTDGRFLKTKHDSDMSHVFAVPY